MEEKQQQHSSGIMDLGIWMLIEAKSGVWGWRSGRKWTRKRLPNKFDFQELNCERPLIGQSMTVDDGRRMAMSFGGCFFDGREAEEWERGKREH